MVSIDFESLIDFDCSFFKDLEIVLIFFNVEENVEEMDEELFTSFNLLGCIEIGDEAFAVTGADSKSTTLLRFFDFFERFFESDGFSKL